MVCGVLLRTAPLSWDMRGAHAYDHDSVNTCTRGPSLLHLHLCGGWGKGTKPVKPSTPTWRSSGLELPKSPRPESRSGQLAGWNSKYPPSRPERALREETTRWPVGHAAVVEVGQALLRLEEDLDRRQQRNSGLQVFMPLILDSISMNHKIRKIAVNAVDLGAVE